MNKALLINSTTGTITEHAIKSWRDIAPAIKCEMFTCVTLDERGLTAYVDDMGLYNSPTHFMKFDSYSQPIAGNAVILGTDHEGESVDAHLSVEEMGKKVKFLTVDEVRRGEY